ncbi:MAG: hypothetical protein SPE21_03840, partial [Candidatus Cryptobacteroides sp.]|nr:hypothetical protein [Candidatus Cryptobacteroides sp.]
RIILNRFPIKHIGYFLEFFFRFVDYFFLSRLNFELNGHFDNCAIQRPDLIPCLVTTILT